MKRTVLAIVMALLLQAARAADDPGGFNGALWGESSAQVRTKSGAQGWQGDPVQNGFPPELGITVFRTNAKLAGYDASIRYYFQNDRFFQATADFDFKDLENFDFNYNVFRSVNEYYTAIRGRTILFVNDIYDLLRSKYGRREPVFSGLDPRFAFVELDRYVLQERWNLRYHPYDFYLNIVAASYARWDFPRTRVLFSMNISASQKRFDYRLSLSSVHATPQIRKAMDALRAGGL